MRCGIDDKRVLEIDHVKGDGHLDREKVVSIYRKILTSPRDDTKYQILCANCHRIKTIENGDHLSRRKKETISRENLEVDDEILSTPA